MKFRIFDQCSVQEDVLKEKKRLCSRLHIPVATSSFKDTLTGSQGPWVEAYRKECASKFSAGESSVLANVSQNPLKLPVRGVYCPALLRASKLWLLVNPSMFDEVSAERMMLPDEHLQLMGIAAFPGCSGGRPFPMINTPLTATAKKSLAGNVTWLPYIGICS